MVGGYTMNNTAFEANVVDYRGKAVVVNSNIYKGVANVTNHNTETDQFLLWFGSRSYWFENHEILFVDEDGWK
jgi:hypothetical protein